MAQRISQKALASVLKQRAAIEKSQDKLKVAESVIFESLKAGATVQAGLFVAELKSFERRNVGWKPVLIREIDARDGEGTGEKLADRISAATKPSVYENLVVRIAG